MRVCVLACVCVGWFDSVRVTGLVQRPQGSVVLASDLSRVCQPISESAANSQSLGGTARGTTCKALGTAPGTWPVPNIC